MKLMKCKDCNELYDLVFEGDSCKGEGCACESLEDIKPQTADWKNEKHVPIIEKTDNGIKVTVGSTLHPMTEEHWITMIEVVDGNMQYRAYLKPGDSPSAEFPINNTDVLAREFCNIHGLWANKE